MAAVQGRKLKPIQRSAELVLQPLGMHAVPAIVSVLHHVGKGGPGAFPLFRQLQVVSLDVTHLADDDDLLPGQLAASDQLAQHAPHHPFLKRPIS